MLLAFNQQHWPKSSFIKTVRCWSASLGRERWQIILEHSAWLEFSQHTRPMQNVFFLFKRLNTLWWTNILPWKDPPFFMGKSTISMVIFHDYVSSPEGNPWLPSYNSPYYRFKSNSDSGLHGPKFAQLPRRWSGCPMYFSRLMKYSLLDKFHETYGLNNMIIIYIYIIYMICYTHQPS